VGTIWTKTRKTSVIQGRRLPLYAFLLLILFVGFAWDLFKERPVAVQAEDAVILGEEEMIELSTREGGEAIEVLAKVDTGAGYSSIVRTYAERESATLKV
jgi:hypothetical protein